MLKVFPPSRVRRSTILLVDDEPFVAHARKFALEKCFHRVERVRDAAEAFVRLEQPGHGIALVIAALHHPGLAGPEFVSELSSRFKRMPILVLGRAGEIAPDYSGDQICFLPYHASVEDIVVAAGGMLTPVLARIA